MLAVAGRALAAAPTAAEVASWAEETLPAELARRGVAGATLAVVTRDEVLHVAGFGLADSATGRQVDPEETRFMIGSITKVFTAVAALQQVERGTLHLDTPDDGLPLRALLTHSAGLAELSRGTRARDAAEVRPLAERLAATPTLRTFPVGAFAIYTNAAFAHAGLRVEQAAGRDYADVVAADILAPLGMTRTHVRQDPPAGVLAHFAAGHARGPDGAHLPQPREFADPLPPGAIWSTAGDMARFARAVLRAGELDGRRILETDTARAMRRPHFSNEPRAGAMGLGWWLTNEAGRAVVSHGGRNQHFRAGLWLLPEEGVGLFVAFNGVHGSPDAVWARFRGRFFPGPVPPPPADPTLTDVRELAGVYHDLRFGRRGVLRLMNLALAETLTVDPAGRLLRRGRELVEVAPLVFEPADGAPDERLHFRRDAGGAPWAYTVGGAPPVMRFQLRFTETPRFHAAVAGAAAAVMTVGLIAPAAAAWRRREPLEGPARTARNAALASVLLLAGAAALILLGGGVREVYYHGLSPLLRLGAFLPALALPATLAFAVAGALAWKSGRWSRWDLAGHLLLLAALAAMQFEFFHWGWWGWLGG